MIYGKVTVCTRAQREIRRSFNLLAGQCRAPKVAAYMMMVVYSATTLLLYGYSTATNGFLGRRISLPWMAKRDEAEYDGATDTMKQSSLCQHQTFTLPLVESVLLDTHLDSVIGCVPPFIISITGWVGSGRAKIFISLGTYVDAGNSGRGFEG